MGDSNRKSIKDIPPIKPQLKGDANISVDVDGLDCYRAIHGLPLAPPNSVDPTWTTGLRRARELFAEFEIPATFFIVGRDLERPNHRQIARQLVDDDHELANHSYDHPYDLRRQPESEISYQLGATDRAILEATGQKPVGFRTPGYNVSAEIIAFSRRQGHRYDASLFPCSSYWAAKALVMGWRAFQGQESRSDRTDPRTLLAPREPYFPRPLHFWKAAPTAKNYVEIPMTVFAGGTIPIIGTSLHLIDAVRWERIWPILHRRFARFFSLEFHALDFLDATDLHNVYGARALLDRQPDLHISWHNKAHRYRRVLHSICSTRQPITLAGATAGINEPG